MTLSQDILTAADTIDKLNAHMEFGDRAHWNASELRTIAKAVEEEEQESAQRETMVARLAMAIFNTNHWGYPQARKLAEALIDEGWRDDA